MPSLATCRCPFRLVRRCFLSRWICLLVSEGFRLVWWCRLFDYSTYIPFCVHWRGGQCLQRLVPNYAVVFRLGWVYLPVSLCHRRSWPLPPITKTIQVRRARHVGHCWRSRDELISDVFLWTPHMTEQKQDYQLEHTYSNDVRIRDVALKTYQKRWTIGRNGERGHGISVPAARHDDDDDDDD